MTQNLGFVLCKTGATGPLYLPCVAIGWLNAVSGHQGVLLNAVLLMAVKFREGVT